jgi:hypothetical protein
MYPCVASSATELASRSIRIERSAVPDGDWRVTIHGLDRAVWIEGGDAVAGAGANRATVVKATIDTAVTGTNGFPDPSTAHDSARCASSRQQAFALLDERRQTVEVP